MNGVSQRVRGLPAHVYNRDEEVFVQADFEAELKRATLWGVNAACTARGGRGVH